jgi:hypothetical protein
MPGGHGDALQLRRQSGARCESMVQTLFPGVVQPAPHFPDFISAGEVGGGQVKRKD